MPETVRKTCKEKLRATPAQERALDEVLWRCRTRSNIALEHRITAWHRCHICVSRQEQEAQLKAILKAIRAAFPASAARHSHALQDVLARRDTPSQACLRRVQRGEQAGFPRVKGRDRYHRAIPKAPSVSFKEQGNGARLENGALVLAKIGRSSVDWSRPMAGPPKTVTIAKAADGWQVAIACAEVPTEPLPLTGPQTGIDLGLESFAPLAAGSQIATPRRFRVAEMALKRAQRRVSRRQKGSHRRTTAVTLLAKAHQPVRRQRTDFHHKAAPALVQRYDVIVHEDLRLRTMVQNHALATSSSAAGWRAFLARLTFTAARAGKRVQAVNPACTSQTCSGCGVSVSKGVSVRWHTCPACGTSLQRDHNAALNMQRLGHEQSRWDTAFRRERSPLGQTQPENPWGLSPGGVSDTV